MFINFSNHPSSRWSEEQRSAAEHFGVICDIQFPTVEPTAGKDEIRMLGDQCAKEIRSHLNPKDKNCVMCSGEYTLTFYIVGILHEWGIKTVNATTERVTVEIPREDGSVEKRSEFRFVQFREYL